MGGKKQNRKPTYVKVSVAKYELTLSEIVDITREFGTKRAVFVFFRNVTEGTGMVI